MAIVFAISMWLDHLLKNFVFASANFEDANAMLTMFVMPVVLPQSVGEVPVVELMLK